MEKEPINVYSLEVTVGALKDINPPTPDGLALPQSTGFSREKALFSLQMRNLGTTTRERLRHKAEELAFNGTPEELTVWNVSADKWSRLDKRLLDISEGILNLERRILNNSSGEELDGERTRRKDLAEDMCALLRISTGLSFEGNLRERVRLSEKHGFADFLTPAAVSTIRFGSCSPLFVKINGKSSFDILEGNFRMPEYLALVMKATRAQGKNAYDDILLQNPDVLFVKEYPEMSTGITREACKELILLSTLNADLFKAINVSPMNEMEKQIIEKAKKITEGMGKIKRALCSEILNPQSPDFADLSNVLQQYLDGGDDNLQFKALVAMGLDDDNSKGISYRTAVELAKMTDGSKSAFYTRFAEAVKNFTRKAGLFTNFYTAEEANIFFGQNHAEDNPSPPFDQLIKITNEIAGISSQADYTVKPEKIPNIHPEIEKITVKINSGSRVLIATMEKKDRSSFLVGLNLKEQGLIWQFLEDPKDPEMKSLSDKSIRILYSALLDVRQQAQDERVKRLRERAMVTQLPVEEIQRRPKPEWAPRKKEGKSEGKQKTAPNIIDETSASPKTPDNEKQKAPKRCLRFPREDYDKLMANIPLKNRQSITAKLKSFNREGQGEFTKTHMEHDGLPVHRFKAGKFRVLAIEESAGNGRVNFKIYKIDLRGNVYQK